MMMGTWMASHGVPASTGGTGWMNPSIGKRSVSAIVRNAIAFAFSTTSRFRMIANASTANSPTPQARKSSDSYMFAAGMRPASIQRVAMPQVITANPPRSPANASASSTFRFPFQAKIESTSARRARSRRPGSAAPRCR